MHARENRDAQLARQLNQEEKERATDAAFLKRKDELDTLISNNIGKTSTKDYSYMDACGNPGHIVALVGEASAGKSSMINATNHTLHSIGLGSGETKPCLVGNGNGNGTGQAQVVPLADGFAMADTRGYVLHGESATAPQPRSNRLPTTASPTTRTLSGMARHPGSARSAPGWRRSARSQRSYTCTTPR
jgi:ribosome biogenesis GTPase A